MDNQFKFSFSDLTLDEVNSILTALLELPAKVCNPLSNKLREQAESQLKAASTE